MTHTGTDDSRTDTSTIGGGALTAFKYGDAVWGQVMTCLKDTFEDFNLVITDVDPGSATHLEIMIAGSPQQIGRAANVGGVAPFTCMSYQSNALVFDFADVWGQGSTCGGMCVEDICSTAAQEIAHTWSLDHVIVAADPMTYYPYLGRRYYQNTAAQCGSDCQGGVGPLPGETCSGTNTQNHACYCTGAQTQNSFTTIKGLFGPGTPTPPVVTITNPAFGANVQAGFNVTATATDASLIQKVELRVDNVLVMPTLTKQPYAFNAPADLQVGTHHVEVRAYDAHNTPGNGAIDVMIGPPCGSASDCSNATDVCIGGRCVPGPDAPGGLGMPCTDNSQCVEMQCASDGTSMYCVSNCTTGQCPSGFGCLSTGADPNVGACWPNYDDGSGGGCSVAAGGPLSFAFLLAALLFVRRRPPREARAGRTIPWRS